MPNERERLFFKGVRGGAFVALVGIPAGGGGAWAADLSFDPEVERRAYGGRIDGPYLHPLLSPSVEVLGLDSAGDPAALLHDLVLRTTFDGTGEGPIEVVRSVHRVEREATDSDELGPRGEVGEVEMPLVDPEVLDLMARAESGLIEDVDIVVALDRLSWNPIVSAEQELFLAMLEGRVRTTRDALQVKHEAMLAKRAAGEAALAPVLESVVALGGEVLTIGGETGTAKLRIASDRLAALVEVEGLAHVDWVRADDPAAGYPTGTEVGGTTLDGEELENLLQSTQFYDSGYYGSSDGYIGLTEGNYPDAGNYVRRSHLGFDNVVGVDRFENCYNVSGSTCGSNPNPDPGNHHATWVASILLGDITRGQDSSIPTAGRRKRSGVARRAHGLGDDSDTTTTPAVMTAVSRDIHILNHSAGNPVVECSGTTTYDQGWNSMFEDGIAIFKAAGNDGHPTSDCTVRDPGSALGVFTVGAYQVNSSDDEVIYPDQSRGGGVYCPGGSCAADGRTILDIQGPTDHQYAYAEDSTDSPQYTTGLNATSGATPSVAGAAALYRDWYLDGAGTLIDSPGVLYADLLLMGDRLSEGGTFLDTGFDELTGAGRLRLRKWDNLDLPARADEGIVCVDDGTSVYIELDDDPLASDVDMAKAVIWWYDHRHDSGSAPHDKVHLALQTYSTSLGAWVSVKLSTTDDNKQRVFIDEVANQRYRLKITGNDVTSDSEGCGTNSTRVYWAYLFEDQDRDTGTDLDDQIRPEE